jgi:hypothetical protein
MTLIYLFTFYSLFYNCYFETSFCAVENIHCVNAPVVKNKCFCVRDKGVGRVQTKTYAHSKSSVMQLTSANKVG